MSENAGKKPHNIDKHKEHTQTRVATNSRHAFVFLYQEHSLTLDMCKDRCTVAGLAMIFYVARTLILAEQPGSVKKQAIKQANMHHRPVTVQIFARPCASSVK